MVFEANPPKQVKQETIEGKKPKHETSIPNLTSGALFDPNQLSDYEMVSGGPQSMRTSMTTEMKDLEKEDVEHERL